MIYYCPSCGAHQDVALAKVIKDIWNNTLKSNPDMQLPQGYPCPRGCGMLKQLTPNDRIYIRPANVEKIVDLEQGEGKA